MRVWIVALLAWSPRSSWHDHRAQPRELSAVEPIIALELRSRCCSPSWGVLTELGPARMGRTITPHLRRDRRPPPRYRPTPGKPTGVSHMTYVLAGGDGRHRRLLCLVGR